MYRCHLIDTSGHLEVTTTYASSRYAQYPAFTLFHYHLIDTSRHPWITTAYTSSLYARYPAFTLF